MYDIYKCEPTKSRIYVVVASQVLRYSAVNAVVMKEGEYMLFDWLFSLGPFEM
jgi:hypothetical protein